MDGRGRAAVTDDVGAPARMRGEEAVIHDEVDRGAGDDGLTMPLLRYQD